MVLSSEKMKKSIYLSDPAFYIKWSMSFQLQFDRDHEIIPEIGTPERNHILFPNVDGKKQTNSGLLSSKEKMITSNVLGNFTQRTPVKKQIQVPRIGSAFGCGNSTPGRGVTINSTSGRGVTINSLRHKNTFSSSKVYMSSNMDNKKLSLGKNLPQSPLRTKYLPKSSQKNIPDVKANNQIATKHVIKRASSTWPPLDAGMKSR